MVLGSNLGRDKTFSSCLGQGSVVHIVTILLAGWSWVQIVAGEKIFVLFEAGLRGSYGDNSTSWMVLGSILGRDKRFFSCFGQGSVVCIVTILLAGWSWVEILVGTKDISFIWGSLAWFIW